MATLFRQKSLEKLSSPEQLDQLVQITSSKGWIALIAIAGLIVCAVIWGIWGAIPDKVFGQGILMKTSGVFDVVSSSSGRLKDIYLRTGEVVHRGQIVGRIAQPDLVQQIRQAESELNDLRDKFSKVEKFGLEEIKLEYESIANQKTNMEKSIAALKLRVTNLKSRLENYRELYRDGLIVKQKVFNTEQELKAVKLEIEQKTNQIKDLAARKVKLKDQNEQDMLTLKHQVDRAERNMQTLRDRLSRRTKIISPYSGRILEIAVSEGSIVNVGTSIMTVELIGKEIRGMEAILYFSPLEGKKIQREMRIQVAPSTVKQEEFGFMEGIVTFVSEFPATPEGMMRKLQNQTLVQSLSMGSPPIEVRAYLIPDIKTPSGYKWSSGDGPKIKIGTGTVCTAAVTVSKQPPVNLVIPKIKKHLLGVGEDTE